MPKVLIPAPYRGPTHGEGELVVEAGTVRECMLATDRKFPGFAAQVLDAKGGVHRFVKLFRNGELVDPKRIDQAVDPGDEIEIVAAIAGG